MSDEPDSGAGQLQDEILRLIEYHAKESDMSICEAFGVLKMVEIKLSQGAKPAHVGILTSAKNTT